MRLVRSSALVSPSNRVCMGCSRVFTRKPQAGAAGEQDSMGQGQGIRQG